MSDEIANPYEDGRVPDADDLWSVDPNAAVEDWLDENDPLPPAKLSNVASAFQRVGDPAVDESDEGVVEDDHLRVADAEAFGRFAHEQDVAVLEPAEGVELEYGYLYGYTPNRDTAEDAGVPLLVCLPGPLPDAVSWLEDFSAAIADMPRFGLVRP